MDIQAYIQSGIVEQYVLGLADAAESAELEQLRAVYPELDNAITGFESSLEQAAFANAVPPPAFIKTALQEQLFPGAPVVQLSGPASTKAMKSGFWKYVAAASIILLAGSTALNLYFYNGYKDSTARYETLLAQTGTLQANNATYKQSLQMFQDSLMKQVPMKPLPGRGDNFATVLWNQQSKSVYIYAANMQQAPKGKQYQLWAIVNGQPVSAGVIDPACTGVCKLATIPQAEAFAITLENEGGSAAPTLTEMYVLGKV